MSKAPFRATFSLCFLLIFSVCLHAGGLYFPAGARQAGMGRCSVSLTDFWSVQNNPAGIATLDRFQAGIFYENRYMLGSLGLKHIAVVCPVKAGTLGLTLSHFGYSQYSDMKAGLSFARSFGPKFSAGLQLDYLITSIGNGYGSNGTVTFEMGIQTLLSDNITLAAWIFNPLNIKLDKEKKENLPVIFRLGAAWRITDHLLTTLECEKNSAWPLVVVRGGMEYAISQKYFLRGGFSTSLEILTLGFGWRIGRLQFDISSVMHQLLGFSTQFSMDINF